MESLNLDCLSSTSILITRSSILHSPTSNIFFLTSILHLQIFFSIHSQKYGIFGSKSPQNSVISDKMSASAACSFFQVWVVCKPIFQLSRRTKLLDFFLPKDFLQHSDPFEKKEKALSDFVPLEIR